MFPISTASLCHYHRDTSVIIWTQELSLVSFIKIQIQMLPTQQTWQSYYCRCLVLSRRMRRVAHKERCSFSPAEGFEQAGSSRKHQGLSPLAVPQAGDGIFTWQHPSSHCKDTTVPHQPPHLLQVLRLQFILRAWKVWAFFRSWKRRNTFSSWREIGGYRGWRMTTDKHIHHSWWLFLENNTAS